jgi:hypothetical protein
LGREDFGHSAWVEKLAVAANMTVDAFRSRFEYLN